MKLIEIPRADALRRELEIAVLTRRAVVKGDLGDVRAYFEGSGWDVGRVLSHNQIRAALIEPFNSVIRGIRGQLEALGVEVTEDDLEIGE